MDGMGQLVDGHVWTKPTTTNITFPATIRKIYYGGDFECVFAKCSQLLSTGLPNQLSWTGIRYLWFLILLLHVQCLINEMT
ncbi:hypothetical protein GOP47_0011430, partial [Adiantum capillus-veneris]